MTQYSVQITGTMPLLMHKDTLADALHPLTKEHKRISGKKTKTDDDHEKMAQTDFMGAIYLDAQGAPCIPASNIKKCMIEGARITKSGPKIERGVVILGMDFPLEYTGPKTAAGLFADPRFVDRRSVRATSTSRIMRVRPIFREWGCQFDLHADDAVCSQDDLEIILANAGNLIGIGDHRKIGGYGRFTAVVKAR